MRSVSLLLACYAHAAGAEGPCSTETMTAIVQSQGDQSKARAAVMAATTECRSCIMSKNGQGPAVMLSSCAADPAAIMAIAKDSNATSSGNAADTCPRYGGKCGAGGLTCEVIAIDATGMGTVWINDRTCGRADCCDTYADIPTTEIVAVWPELAEPGARFIRNLLFLHGS